LTHNFLKANPSQPVRELKRTGVFCSQVEDGPSQELNTMNRKRFLLVIAACLPLTTLTAAQMPPPPAANMINVSVLVSENRGDRAVIGIRIDQFRLFEDQDEQTIVAIKENSLAGDYTLSYTPRKAATLRGWRRVRVEIAGDLRSHVTVRHSAGYYADPLTR
jgi:hypothetical protein